MTDVETTEALPPVAHATIVYLGPVAPHWEIRGHFGDEKFLDDFRTRVNARLLLLPRHDPQFRRNRERVNRDAERELIRLDWDLGDEPGSTMTQGAVQAAEVPVVDAPVVDAPVVDAPVVDAPVVEPEAEVVDPDATTADVEEPAVD